MEVLFVLLCCQIAEGRLAHQAHHGEGSSYSGYLTEVEYLLSFEYLFELVIDLCTESFYYALSNLHEGEKSHFIFPPIKLPPLTLPPIKLTLPPLTVPPVLEEGFEYVKGGLQKAKKFVDEALKSPVGQAIMGAATTLVNGAADLAIPVFGAVIDKITDVSSAILEESSTRLTLAYGKLKSAADSVITFGGVPLSSVAEDLAKGGERIFLAAPNLIEKFLEKSGKLLIYTLNMTYPLGNNLFCLAFETVKDYVVTAWNKPLKYIFTEVIFPILTTIIPTYLQYASLSVLSTLATGFIVGMIVLFIKHLIDHFMENYLKQEFPETYKSIKCLCSKTAVKIMLTVAEAVLSTILFSYVSDKLEPTIYRANLKGLNDVLPQKAGYYGFQIGTIISESMNKLLPFLSLSMVETVLTSTIGVIASIIGMVFFPENKTTDACNITDEGIEDDEGTQKTQKTGRAYSHNIKPTLTQKVVAMMLSLNPKYLA